MPNETSGRRLRVEVSVASSTAAPDIRGMPQPWVAKLDRVVEGGEIVVLAIKPSLWRPVLELAPWLAICGLLAGALMYFGRPAAGLSMTATAQLIALIAFAPLAAAFVRWVSTWYVVTNRRVIDVSGVLDPKMWACPLVELRNTYLTESWLERPARLGTIVFATDQPDQPPRQWRCVVAPHDVHAEIRRAIENALDHHV